MPDWTHTLDARQRGALPGFLATDLPLEDQDEDQGGPRVEIPAEDVEPEPVFTPSEADVPADVPPADEADAVEQKRTSRSR